MKYIGKYFLLGVLVAAAGLPLRAQVTYLSPGLSPGPSPGNSLVSTPASSLDSSQPDESVITIKKRVDEVNVLFIATDKHGKFVRNLGAKDFAILDHHERLMLPRIHAAEQQTANLQSTPGKRFEPLHHLHGEPIDEIEIDRNGNRLAFAIPVVKDLRSSR